MKIHITSAYLILALLGCASPVEQPNQEPDLHAAASPVVEGLPVLISNSSVEQTLRNPDEQPPSTISEYFPREIGEIEKLPSIDDFRELLVPPERISLWKSNGVCVFYGFSGPTRVRNREGIQVIVTNGMSVFNVVASALRGHHPGKHPVRLFGRNKIIEIMLPPKHEKFDLQDSENSGCASVEAGDIIMMLPRMY